MNIPEALLQLKPGDQILLNRKSKGHLWWKQGEGSWFSSAQRFFTGKDYTHCAVIREVDSDGVVWAMSAEERFTLWSVEDFLLEDYTDIEIWRPRKVTGEDIERASNATMKKYMGKSYAFGQLFYFVWRWLAGKFGKDVRKMPWISEKPVCSEANYFNISQLYLDQIRFSNVWHYLDMFTKDTCHAGDVADIIHASGQFDLIFTWYKPL